MCQTACEHALGLWWTRRIGRRSNFRTGHRGDPPLEAPSMRQPNLPGKAVPAPGARRRNHRGPEWPAFQPPRTPSAPSDTPSRALCPCIASLGYSRRGLQAVRHMANRARPQTGACASCPRPCVCAGSTQAMAACIHSSAVDVVQASRRVAVALRCHPTFGGLCESLETVSCPSPCALPGLPCALGSAQPLLLPEKRGRPAGPT